MRMIRLVMIRQNSAATMSIMAATLMAAAVSAVPTVPAMAQQKPKLEGKFNDWAAYVYKNKKGKVCYIVSKPKSSTPKGAKRDPIYFLVTHRPGDKVHNEVNTIIGYPFKKNSTVTIAIDNNDYQLFTSGDGAWADSAASDKKIVRAMKNGKSMKITGTSWRGTKTADNYSLAGVTAAMDKIDRLCK